MDDFKMCLAWDLDLWADAEHAKIAAKTERALKAFEPQPDPLWVLWQGMRNMNSRELAQMQMQRDYRSQHDQMLGAWHFDPLGGPNLLAPLLGF